MQASLPFGLVVYTQMGPKSEWDLLRRHSARFIRFALLLSPNRNIRRLHFFFFFLSFSVC